MKDRPRSRHEEEPKPKAAAQAVEAKPERAVVRCGTCQQPCSQAGHLRGKEITPKDAKGYKLFECARCGLYLEQPACECCGVEIGTMHPSADDSAQEAAKRMEAR